MNLPSCEAEVTTFYLDLRTSEEIDLRDNRGKRHDLSVILIGVCIALFCKRDGNLLSIHWHIQNHYSELCLSLNIKPFKVASRAQLPLVANSSFKCNWLLNFCFGLNTVMVNKIRAFFSVYY